MKKRVKKNEREDVEEENIKNMITRNKDKS